MKNTINKTFPKLLLSFVMFLICTPLKADVNSDLITLCNNNVNCKTAVRNSDMAKYAIACASVKACADNIIFQRYKASIKVVVQEAAALSTGDEIVDLNCNDPEVAKKYPSCTLSD